MHSALWWVAVLVPQQRMAADGAPHEGDLALEIAATLANAQMHPHSPALEPTEPAVLSEGYELGNLSASQQRRVLLFVLVEVPSGRE